MSKYELAVVLKPNLEEEMQKAEFDKILGIITRFDGTIEKVDDWGKHRLAYEIQKNTDGFYSFISFTSDSQVPEEIESRLRIMENVLRYLIINQDE